MPQVQATTTITVDGAVFSVEKMSPQIKQLVMFMDEWRQKDVDLSIDVAMVKAALRDIQNNIYVAINKEKEEAMAKAKAMGLVPDTQPVPAAANEAAAPKGE
jgi:hypothetical protein